MNDLIHRLGQHYYISGTNDTKAIVKEAQDRIRALEGELARCRAANVYDGNAHRKVAEFEVALQRIAAYSPGLTPIPGDPIEIARTALETPAQFCMGCSSKWPVHEGGDGLKYHDGPSGYRHVCSALETKGESNGS